jgi:multidrug resistance efflux pump
MNASTESIKRWIVEAEDRLAHAQAAATSAQAEIDRLQAELTAREAPLADATPVA